MGTNRVLIADDHTIVRSGIKLIIQDLLPSTVIDEASNGDEVISCVKKNDYELIVLDINMPDTDSITLVTNLLAYREHSRILIYSMNSEELYAKRFIKLGVLGYLNKESRAEEIRRAITCVLKGDIYISKKVRKDLSEDMLSKKGADNPFERLSDREIQTVKYLLHGYSLLEIKKILNIHSSTVGTYKTRIFEKLKIKTLRELDELARMYQLEISKL
ncbi:response regulator transcription factor [Flavitalea sp. BT771]|uniref:response regulator n=1 Tax=Flavitalea sp. BT771 TaxID=3063329 RepID=UPI0026E269EA|nr:response regulator transcription factor [Flavitalea sp. BT771]MDO6429953.1 response regulator transcription factor [Flavitalea sp. BT771]MDV6217919.1 response regulator transcription factor [Flavitalea sp. BT771]